MAPATGPSAVAIARQLMRAGEYYPLLITD